MVASLQDLQLRDWTFRHVKAREGIHGLHHYPAMMAPPVARALIEDLTRLGDTVLDPFCGSGTVTTEAALLGRPAVGLDINPLALLIAEVKATPLPPPALVSAFERVSEAYLAPGEPERPAFPNLEFWFKPAVIAGLARLKRAIGALGPGPIQNLYWVLFSRVVRQTSNTRDNEFKLFRFPPDRLERHEPDVWACFERRYREAYKIVAAFYRQAGSALVAPRVMLHDSRQPLPDALLPAESVDLMLTSPPYGDSRTTVAYGQFCRLSLQWLDRWEQDLDRLGLGGVLRPVGQPFERKGPTLAASLAEVAEASAQRARDAEAFYADLHLCLQDIAPVVKPGGYAVFVVANRKVRGVLMPTDQIVREMMEAIAFDHVVTLRREIPNKRMPLRNSPSNVPGDTDHTMLHEHIVVLRRQPRSI